MTPLRDSLRRGSRGRQPPVGLHPQTVVARAPATKAQQVGNRNLRGILNARAHASRAPSPTLAGVVLGTNRNGESVAVSRQLGGASGYDDRWQATAVARLARAEPAAVVLAANGRWYPVETTAAPDPGKLAGDSGAAEHIANGNAPIEEVYGLPPLSGVGPARRRLDELEAKRTRLDARQARHRDDPRLAADQEELGHDLARATQARAAAVLGVPESDIRLTMFADARKPGSINIVRIPGRGSSGAGQGSIGESGFEDGRASAFWIDLPELDTARAAESLFHEDQHQRDQDLTQTWVSAYGRETHKIFVKSQPRPFAEWLIAQARKGRLTKADAELVLMGAADASGYTEANANIRSFLADLLTGNPELARKAIVAYAHALEPKGEGGLGQYGSPAPKSEVVAALVKELATEYARMPREMKRQYDDAVAAAVMEYPSAWITVLDFAKRGTK